MPVDNSDIRWRVVEKECTCVPGDVSYSLTIPTDEALAPIIDGQHRLFGFNFCDKPDRMDMGLVCSIFLDLPKPFQAFLFATINSNQRPVNKSQTYEAFGYNIEKELPDSWSPDKLAVFLARKLNAEDDSPLKGRILIAAENDFAMTRIEARQQGTWMVSMATVVEGISRLVSQNPKRDRTALLKRHPNDRRREILTSEVPADRSPLRSLYLAANDKVVYAAVKNFMIAANDMFWNKCQPASFICKTVGVQALFDTLVELSKEGLASKTFSVEFFRERLRAAADIDFTATLFQNASGAGRLIIRTCILFRLGLKNEEDLPASNKEEILAVLRDVRSVEYR